MPDITRENLLKMHQKGKKFNFKNMSCYDIDFDDNDHLYTIYRPYQTTIKSKKDEFKRFQTKIQSAFESMKPYVYIVSFTYCVNKKDSIYHNICLIFKSYERKEKYANLFIIDTSTRMSSYDGYERKIQDMLGLDLSQFKIIFPIISNQHPDMMQYSITNRYCKKHQVDKITDRWLKGTCTTSILDTLYLLPFLLILNFPTTEDDIPRKRDIHIKHLLTALIRFGRTDMQIRNSIQMFVNQGMKEFRKLQKFINKMDKITGKDRIVTNFGINNPVNVEIQQSHNQNMNENTRRLFTKIVRIPQVDFQRNEITGRKYIQIPNERIQDLVHTGLKSVTKSNINMIRTFKRNQRVGGD